MQRDSCDRSSWCSSSQRTVIRNVPKHVQNIVAGNIAASSTKSSNIIVKPEQSRCRGCPEVAMVAGGGVLVPVGGLTVNSVQNIAKESLRRLVDPGSFPVGTPAAAIAFVVLRARSDPPHSPEQVCRILEKVAAGIGGGGDGLGAGGGGNGGGCGGNGLFGGRGGEGG
eukprot:6236753-Prymnesium_polylepis.3